MTPHHWVGDYGGLCFVDETGWMWTEHEDRDLDGRFSASYQEIARLAAEVERLVNREEKLRSVITHALKEISQ